MADDFTLNAAIAVTVSSSIMGYVGQVCRSLTDTYCVLVV